jgi:hypothetical protein
MISDAITRLVQCPDCAATLTRPTGHDMVCSGCGRRFDLSLGYVDLRPATSFTEQTKYLDHDLHADARHESIAPPVLGSKIRNDMLRRFLRPAPGDQIADLGCGSGRAIVWNAGSGAAILGVDISPFFAREAIERADLILGDPAACPSPPALSTRPGRSTSWSTSRRRRSGTSSARPIVSSLQAAPCSSTLTSGRTAGRLPASGSSTGLHTCASAGV